MLKKEQVEIARIKEIATANNLAVNKMWREKRKRANAINSRQLKYSLRCIKYSDITAENDCKIAFAKQVAAEFNYVYKVHIAYNKYVAYISFKLA